MRTVCTLRNAEKAKQYSDFLTLKGIDNHLEKSVNRDWGSPDYGSIEYNIWIYDEDLIEDATRHLESLGLDGTNKNSYPATFLKEPESKVIMPTEILTGDQPEKNGPDKTHLFYTKDPFQRSKGTFYLVLICCILFMIDTLSEPEVTDYPEYLPPTPLFASQLKKDTLYDYPYAYTIVNDLENSYGILRLMTPETLPPEGKKLINTFFTTPYWQGFYEQLKTDTLKINAPMFEKIRQGEFWRLLTPAFLHNDILHLLFNMLWLFVLGKQIEQRLGIKRYLIFIVLTAIFSSTAQYLMSGPNFLGFSGVLCAMLTFIKVRQWIAPKEHYPLDSSTFYFMMTFILAMALIQTGSFYLENYQHISISPGIANTAHLSGAISGALLGLLPYFSKQSKSHSDER